MELFWVECPGPGRLAVATRPRGGDWLEDDLAAARRVGVTVLVSALESVEAAELGLELEEECCSSVGLEFVPVATPDRGVPGPGASAKVRGLADVVAAGGSVAIHCRQALGRAPTVAAAVLVALGVPEGEAWRSVESARGQVVPETDDQRLWPLRQLEPDKDI